MKMEEYDCSLLCKATCTENWDVKQKILLLNSLGFIC